MPLFITCGRGFEHLLDSELSELGFAQNEIGFCGVTVKDDSLSAIYKINYCSRIAGRVLLPLISFPCSDKRALYQNSLKYDWTKIFAKAQTFAIDANVQHPTLRNSLFAAQVLKDAVCDQLRTLQGTRPNVDIKDPEVQLNLFIDHDHAIVSLDTSGQPLHKRGYRKATGDAPLQETLAAALLRMAQYDPAQTFIDTCAGSGTLLIEAALIASNTPPGYLRKQWGFFAHPQFSESDWLLVKREADALKKPLANHRIFGCEIDPSVLRIANANIDKAGFANELTLYLTDFANHIPQTPYQFLLTNAPHGKRLGSEETLSSLYRDLGHFMKQKMAKPARAFVFTSSTKLAKEIGLAPKRRHVITYGGLDARLLEFDVY